MEEEEEKKKKKKLKKKVDWSRWKNILLQSNTSKQWSELWSAFKPSSSKCQGRNITKVWFMTLWWSEFKSSLQNVGGEKSPLHTNPWKKRSIEVHCIEGSTGVTKEPTERSVDYKIECDKEKSLQKSGQVHIHLEVSMAKDKQVWGVHFQCLS